MIFTPSTIDGGNFEAAPRFELESPFAPTGLETIYGLTLLKAAQVGFDEMTEGTSNLVAMTAFGSVVKGRITPESDVDLALLYHPGEESKSNITAAKKHIQNRIATTAAKLGRPADITDEVIPVAVGGVFFREAVGRLKEEVIPEVISEETEEEEEVVGCWPYGEYALLAPFMFPVGIKDLHETQSELLDMIGGGSSLDDILWKGLARLLCDFEEKKRRAAIELPGTLAEARETFLAPRWLSQSKVLDTVELPA